jgi:hypothetical protein
MRCGKNERPSTTARCAGGRLDRTLPGSRWASGLYPRKAANSVDTGGKLATLSATGREMPSAISPWLRLDASVPDRPTITSVKKIPMESTWAELWNVAFMPEPAPRSWGGRLFITPARLGLANAPMARPFIRSKAAKVQ